jgi:3-oxoacyl-[acyl-carrier-protein] synthase-3
MKNVLKDVLIKGIVTAVPKNVSRVADYKHMSEAESNKFSQVTGIFERRTVSENQSSSDLCCTAAESLLSNLSWDKAEIEILVMITQSADYPIPATAILVQDRLGLDKSTLAFDVNLGCSSYPYGLAIIGSMMKSLGLKKGLLLVGDTSSKLCSYNDKSSWPLFGDAGSATAIEVDSSAGSCIYFDFHSDGSGKNAIIINSGGLASRNPVSVSNIDEVAIAPSISRSPQHLQLVGADVFSFAIKEVPKSIEACLALSSHSVDDIDIVVLHQANKMINDMLIKKTKFDPSKSLSTLEMFGNTSSVSIPLTICANPEAFEVDRNVMLSGFGVGLSWATCVIVMQAGVYLNLLED